MSVADPDAPAKPAAAPPRPWEALAANPYILLALAALMWSGNHVIGRASAGHVPPFGMATVRWIFAALLLWPFARPHLVADWPVIKRHWRIIVFLGLTGGALFSGLQYFGLQHTTALNVSVLNSVAPVLIVAAGALIFRDALVPLQLAGIATSLAGVLLIVARAELETLMGLKFNWADIVIVVNMGIFAVYSACLRRQPPLHWMSFIFILAVISVLGTAPLHLWEHATGFRFQPTVLTLAAVAYVAVFPSVVAFLAWMRGIALIGASRAGAFLHLVPLYSALLAWLLLDERLRDYHVLGFILIIGGVWLAARRQSASVGEPAVPVRGGPVRDSD